jgi:AhpD family alkylhydroperoxidase
LAKNPIEMLSDLEMGTEALGKADSQRMQAFRIFGQAATEPGALDRKTKELIGLALALYSHCDYCIVSHTKKAFEAGANRDEIIETAFVAGLMGGGPIVAYCATLLQDAINTFAPDYGK